MRRCQHYQGAYMTPKYVAMARLLHCDILTAKRWFLSWSYGAGDRTLFDILQGER